jgi:hypothetical protein
MFSVVVIVFTLMQLYLQRSFSARYKAGADYLHNELAKAAPAIAGLRKQYVPYYTISNSTNIKLYNLTTGYPFNSVDQTVIQGAWVLTDVPGEND